MDSPDERGPEAAPRSGRTAQRGRLLAGSSEDDRRQGPPPPSRAGTAPVVVRALLGLSRLVLVTLGAREGHRRGVGEIDRLGLAAEGELLRRALGVVDVDHDDLTSGQLAVEDLLRQRVLDLALDGPAQRPGTQHRVEAAVRQQLLGSRGDLQRHVLVRQLGLHTGGHKVDDLDDLVLGQLVEHDDVVDTVEELRPEVLLELFVDLVLHPLVVARSVVPDLETESDGLRDVPRPEVGREDQDRVLEVYDPALTIGEPAVLQHLQKRVEHVGVGLLDLVEENHRERLAPNLLGQLATLVVTDVTRRGTDEPGNGESGVELTHVDLDERVVLTEQELRQRLRQLRLTDTRGPGEDEGTTRTARFLEARTRAPDRRADALDGLFLADDALVELALHAEQTRGLLLGDLEDRNAGPVSQHLGDLLVVDLGDDVHAPGLPLLLALGLLAPEGLLLVAQRRGLLEVLRVDRRRLLAPDARHPVVELTQVRRRGHPLDPHPGTGLVDQVDRLVRQEAVGDVPVGQRRRGDQGRVGDADPVVRLVPVAQPLEDLDGVLQRRLTDLDGLEAALESGVLLQVLAVLVQRGGSDGLQLAAGQHRLEDAGGVDGALRGTGPDEGVDLVDEQDDVAAGADLLEDLLEPLFEVTAVAGAGDEGAEVQRVELLVLQRLGHLALDDGLREAFDDGGLADAGLADQDGVVLGPPRQDLHDPLDLLGSPDHRVELGVTRGLGQVAAELVENQRGGRRALGGAAGRGRLLALVAGEQLDDLLADAVEGGPELHQDLGGGALTLAGQAQQDVLGADVVVAELQGLAQRELQHLLRPRGEGDVTGRGLLALADDLLDLLADALERDAQGLQCLGGDAFALVDQAQEDVLGADVVVVEHPGLFLGQDNNAAGSVGEPFEHLLLLLRPAGPALSSPFVGRRTRHPSALGGTGLSTVVADHPLPSCSAEAVGGCSVQLMLADACSGPVTPSADTSVIPAPRPSPRRWGGRRRIGTLQEAGGRRRPGPLFGNRAGRYADVRGRHRNISSTPMSGRPRPEARPERAQEQDPPRALRRLRARPEEADSVS